MIEVPIGSIVLFAIALILTMIFAIKQGRTIKEQCMKIDNLNNLEKAFVRLIKTTRKNNEK